MVRPVLPGDVPLWLLVEHFQLQVSPLPALLIDDLVQVGKVGVQVQLDLNLLRLNGEIGDIDILMEAVAEPGAEPQLDGLLGGAAGAGDPPPAARVGRQMVAGPSDSVGYNASWWPR